MGTLFRRQRRRPIPAGAAVAEKNGALYFPYRFDFPLHTVYHGQLCR